jgi:hypothetical protein
MKEAIKAFWNRIKPRNRIKRELPVIHVHTFKTGERLYTYRPEDYGKISSRYYRNIQEATNYLQTFSLAKNEWEAAVTGCKNLIADALESINMQDRTKALLDINSTFDWFLTKVTGLKNANETILEFMFCMFFLLEDERETGYSEVHNKRKLELLNQDPEKRDFFLSSLQQTTNNLLPISREDTLTLLLQMEQMKGALTFLNLQVD